ncbi:MAG: bifunctional folylpolyglutamate synthase/dihydrofolate synthase [Gaiellaceae bacterium]
MPSATDWVAALSPWPEDGFGLERIRAVLTELGEPQRRYPAIHVVGTNGKSTLTRTVDATLRAEGLCVGSFTSPHVTGWGERIHLDGEEADFEAAVARVREVCKRYGATQFEALTAAALQAFADAEVDVAVVEAGLGGRLDATNVLDARVVVLTNVSLEHTDVLGETREAIGREKLAVAGPGATVVLGEPEWADLVPGNPVVIGGAREAAEAFLGRAVELVPAAPPGRLERLDGEIRDGAHNPAGVAWLVERIGEVAVIVCSVLADKDVDAMLAALASRSTRLVATRSSSPRALPAHELADAASRHFSVVETVPDPVRALARAHELGEPVLVTGSLYLLADLAAVRPGGLPWLSSATS